MTATIHGADKIVKAIRNGLTDRGVITPPPDGCPSVDVTVHRVNESIQIDFKDAGGRPERRTAYDIDSAINLIDAWIREGLRDVAPLPPPPDSSEEKETAAAAAASIVAVGAAATMGVSFDGSLWFGARLQVPISLGPVVFGPSVSLQDDPHLTGESNETNTNRLATDITAFIQYPLRLNRLKLRLGIDLGVTVIAADTAAEGDIHLKREDDEEENKNNSAGDHVSATAFIHSEYRETTFFLGARADLLVPLKNKNAVWIGIFISTYPAADHDRRIDSSTETDLPQAGSPIGIVVFAVGLEFPQ